MKTWKYCTVAAILSLVIFLVLNSQAGVRTQTRAQTTVVNSITYPNDPTKFLDGQGNFNSPIGRLNLTSGTIPLSFGTPPLVQFVDSGLSQDFTGNITHNGTRTFSAYDVIFRHPGANVILGTDSGSKSIAINVGANLSYNTATHTLSATGGTGNVTSTPQGGTFANLTMYDADNSVNIVPSGVTADGSGNLVTHDLRINGVLNFGGVNLASIDAGTYAPTVTSANGVTMGSYNCHFVRIGDQVTVDGRFDAALTGAHASTVEITLPPGKTSDLTQPEDLTGSATCTTVNMLNQRETVSIEAQTVHNVAVIDFGADSGLGLNYGKGTFTFHFTYRIQ